MRPGNLPKICFVGFVDTLYQTLHPRGLWPIGHHQLNPHPLLTNVRHSLKFSSWQQVLCYKYQYQY